MNRRIVAATLCLFALSSAAFADPPETNYDESKIAPYVLPDPLIANDGTRVTDVVTWESKRRPEIVKLFEDHVYGKTPGSALPGMHSVVTEESKDALGGKATRRQVTLYFTADEKGPCMDLLVYLPNAVTGPVPAFVGLNFYGNQTVHADPAIAINPRWMRGNKEIGIENNRATEKTRGVYTHRWQVEKLIDNGFALVTACYGDIDPDSYDDNFSDGVHPLFYAAGQTRPADTEWGSIGAWAWGLSRAMDYVETVDAIDAKHVAIIGHSRLGKAALWAGAQDTRFALVISNDSGCGGAALYRRDYGEQVHHMVEGPIGYWFCKAHYKYARKERELPVDQHELIALMAPRPVYVASAVEDPWADPKGEFLSTLNANPVYKVYGKIGLPATEMPSIDTPVMGDLAYHVRTGEHDVLEYDWDQYIAFAKMHFGRP